MDEDARSQDSLLPRDSQRHDAGIVKITPDHCKRPLVNHAVFHRYTRLRARRRPAPDGSKKSEKISNRVPAMKLRYHRLKLWLILLYTAGTCFSWTVTCILCYRPIRLATYRDKGTYTKRQYEDNDWWTTVARITSAIVSAMTIPATSAICAKTAVAYCQTPPSANEKGLTMRQMLTLADKGWSDFHTLTHMVRPNSGRRIRSRLLVLSALLCSLGKHVGPCKLLTFC